jgi:O-antigen/teichoic acid export membrane protein
MEFLLRNISLRVRPHAKPLESSAQSTSVPRAAMVALSIRMGSAAIAFVSQILLARWLGGFQFGVFTYASVWLNVVGSLCAAGFATSALRFLPEYGERQDAAAARAFIAAGRTIAIGCGIVAGVVLAAIVLAGRKWVDQAYIVPFLLVAISLPAYALTDFHDGVGRSQSWIGLALGPSYVLRPLLTLILTFVLVFCGAAQGATAAAGSLAAASWIAAFLQYVKQKPLLAGRFGGWERRSDLRVWVGVSLALLLVDGFSLMLANLDLLLLDLWAEPQVIGHYFAAVKIISLIAFIQFAVSASATGRFSALHFSGRATELDHLLGRTQLWTLVPTIGCAIAILVVGQWMLGLFGEDFVDAYPVMFVMAFGLIVRAAAGPSQCLLMATGRQKAVCTILVVTVAVNLALCLLLIPRFGAMGAAFAVSCAFACESSASMIVARRMLKRA